MCRYITLFLYSFFSKVFSMEHCTGKRYELVTKNMDWDSAAKFCAFKRSAGLVIIKNRYEQRALTRFLRRIHGMSVCLSVLFF